MVLTDLVRRDPVSRRGPSAPAGVPRAVVAGSDHVNGLQVLRILEGHGVPVIGVARNPKHVCSRTRLAERTVVADTGTPALIDALEVLGRSLGTRAVLFPAADRQVRLISEHRRRLEPFSTWSCPTIDVVELLMDKSRFYPYAAEHGFPVARTTFLRDREDAARAAATLRFPCVLKPPTSAALAWDAHGPRKAFMLDSAEAFLDTYDRYGRYAEQLIAQEWIAGPSTNLFSCNAYFAEGGEPVATFVARKIRQWPPETGDSCLGEEVRNDEVLALTVRLFGELGFRGLAYLEVKRDERTGEHVIVEPNVGRPTGRSAIAEAGGVDLHYAMYADALGLPRPANLEQRYRGVKWIYFRRDLQSALGAMRSGDLTVGGYVRSIRGRKRDALFSWRDPGPFLWDFARSARRAVSGGRGRW